MVKLIKKKYFTIVFFSILHFGLKSLEIKSDIVGKYNGNIEN